MFLQQRRRQIRGGIIMEPRYLWLLNYSIPETMIIRLTDEEIDAAIKYDTFEEFVCEVLEPKYEFSLSDCNWMIVDKLNLKIE